MMLNGVKHEQETHTYFLHSASLPVRNSTHLLVTETEKSSLVDCPLRGRSRTEGSLGVCTHLRNWARHAKQQEMPSTGAVVDSLVVCAELGLVRQRRVAEEVESALRTFEL